ncbi:hypothetical protein [Nesterenkonia halotolerans]|uniref:Transcriptional regulator n=1 Tax=Nesterenkonia halotolerans TaxID=225325 RepID=A0ABR9J5P1_9MICC|nr:hypothetical protein [Nesterenkonia halotolerans]MBE1514311.1 hypothetical protein [Nesterenkonia halotolerans]
MPEQPHKHTTKTKAQMFVTLRREILAARLKITLDERQGRTTAPELRDLAAMDVPPASWAMPDHTARTGEG